MLGIHTEQGLNVRGRRLRSPARYHSASNPPVIRPRLSIWSFQKSKAAACLTLRLLALQITRLTANFEEEFLSYLTEPQDAIQIAATFRILSTHAENEEYLTETEPEWIEVCSPLAAYNASPTTTCCSGSNHRLSGGTHTLQH